MMMKKLYILLAVGASVMMSACSDFLDREPMTTPNSETFLSNASAVNNYINGLYIALPSFGTYDMGVRGEEKNSDNIVAEVYDKRLNGELLETGGGTAEWQNGYQNLRNVNYFFEYYKVPEAEETKDVLSLKGEAYFFRAYWHFYLLTRFGSIPVMDKFWDGNATVAGLQITPRDRSAVAQIIIDDFKKAKNLLYSRSQYKGLRICKEAAIIMAMRVALYEGTWEKYHKGTDFAAAEDKSTDLLGQVLTLGDELFAMGLSLNTKDNDKKFVSKEDALKQMKEKVGDKQFLLSGYDENNPFPASYVVTLTDLKESDNVQKEIETFDNIKSIQKRGDTVNALLRVANFVRILSGAILILLVVISIFIIANTIKLTVHARRREISIMKYVGATNNIIRWPFIVEGIIIGVVAALISIMLLGVLYNVVSNKILSIAGSNIINISLLTFSDMFTLIIVVYLALGIVIGTLGSMISMRKYLKV